ncbi:MAG: hypothetical protein L3J41_11880 [Melioribacteraceae bacterium]|nr:hypothetical protein [Melioribacteraceae bacterium]
MSKKVLEELLSLVAPGELSKSFSLTKIREKKEHIIIEFEEDSELIPKELEGKDVVLNGYMNPIEMQTFPLKDKAVYLLVKRRRWKIRGENKKSYHNSYNLTETGIKATPDFGAFLKAVYGRKST